MTSIFDPKHKHYVVHKAYIDGCFVNPNDPPVVQLEGDTEGDWHDKESTIWFDIAEYRIKPRMVTRTISHPEPLKTLTKGQEFWKEAVLNELIVAHIYTADHNNNPRKAVQDAISWNCQVALDPSVSSGAQKLVDSGKAQPAQPVVHTTFESWWSTLHPWVRSGIREGAELGWNAHNAIAQPVAPSNPDAQDAARYRWLRNDQGYCMVKGDELDQLIDRSLRADLTDKISQLKSNLFS